LDDNPVVAPNHAVAISMVAGPRAGLELARRLGTDPRVNFEDHTGLQGELGFGLDRIRMALRSFLRQQG
jgi:predicted RNA polymerase sigma factor